MSPTAKHKKLRHRSFKGCWTCKKRKIQCDEVHPNCQKCSSRGITCEGYEIRLRWGAGIASRGRYSGASKPVLGSILAPSKRRCDMRCTRKQFSAKDGQGEPMLVSRELKNEYQGPELSGERVDVNILSTLREPNSLGQTSEINKHFEVPASLATLSEGPADLHYQPVTDASD